MINYLKPIYNIISRDEGCSMRYNEFDVHYASRVKSFIRHLKFIQTSGLRKHVSKHKILSNFEIWLWDDLNEMYDWFFELYESDRFIEIDQGLEAKPLNQYDNIMFVLSMMFNEHILPLYTMYLGKTLIDESLLYEDTRFNKLPRVPFSKYEKYQPIHVIELYCLFVKNALIQLIREESDESSR